MTHYIFYTLNSSNFLKDHPVKAGWSPSFFLFFIWCDPTQYTKYKFHALRKLNHTLLYGYKIYIKCNFISKPKSLVIVSIISKNEINLIMSHTYFKFRWFVFKFDFIILNLRVYFTVILGSIFIISNIWNFLFFKY